MDQDAHSPGDLRVQQHFEGRPCPIERRRAESRYAIIDMRLTCSPIRRSALLPSRRLSRAIAGWIAASIGRGGVCAATAVKNRTKASNRCKN